jgi:predicted phage tail protein
MQDAKEQDSRRLTEVQRLGGFAEDFPRVTQIRVQVGGDSLRAASQQRPGVHQHDRVVIHIHDLGFRSD